MGTLVEEFVKKLVGKLVSEKCQQKTTSFQIHTNVDLPSCVGKFAKRGREICHPV
jgi:hypothetical protein